MRTKVPKLEQKNDKMKILKKSFFSENLSKIIVKVTKKALILNKNFPLAARKLNGRSGIARSWILLG